MMSSYRLFVCTRQWLLMAAVALALGTAGCQQPAILMKPSLMKIGGEINESSGEVEDIRSTFSGQDEKVVAWASFAQSHGEHTARFKWYNPQGQLAFDSEPITINPENLLYEWRSVWSELPVIESPAALMPGRWKVFIYLNQKKIGTLHFNIEP